MAHCHDLTPCYKDGGYAVACGLLSTGHHKRSGMFGCTWEECDAYYHSGCAGLTANGRRAPNLRRAKELKASLFLFRLIPEPEAAFYCSAACKAAHEAALAALDALDEEEEEAADEGMEDAGEEPEDAEEEAAEAAEEEAAEPEAAEEEDAEEEDSEEEEEAAEEAEEEDEDDDASSDEEMEKRDPSEDLPAEYAAALRSEYKKRSGEDENFSHKAGKAHACQYSVPGKEDEDCEYSAASAKGVEQHHVRWHEGTFGCNGDCGQITFFATNADFIKHRGRGGRPVCELR